MGNSDSTKTGSKFHFLTWSKHSMLNNYMYNGKKLIRTRNYLHVFSTEKQGCGICADIVFLFDDSSSIPVADPHGYAKMKQFMVHAIKSFTSFGPPSGVQVSVVLVAHSIRNHFYLNNFTDEKDIVHSILTFPELKGSATAIGEGLKVGQI